MWVAGSPRHRLSTSLSNGGALLVALVGATWAAFRFAELDHDDEIVRTYETLFSALDRGTNPYTCDCVVHYVEDDTVRLGNFNYLPGEIWPYRLFDLLFRRWDIFVLTLALIILTLTAFAIPL